MTETTETTKRRQLYVWVAFGAVMAVAAFFRLFELGKVAFRGDTILLWSLAQRRVAPGLLFSKWFEVSGAAGQLPMPAWVMQEFLSLTGWHVTPFMVTLPFAVFGILAVAAAYFGGRRLFGTAFGLVFAALAAVNPFHIGMSREVYFYSSGVFGYFLYLWAAAAWTERYWGKEGPAKSEIALMAAAVFFSAYSQVTGAIIVAAGGLLLLGLLVYRQRGTAAFVRNLAVLIGLHAVVLAPVAFASWGWRPIVAQIGANRDVAVQVVAMGGQNLGRAVLEMAAQFAWGWTPAAAALLALVLALGAAAMVKAREGRGLWLAYFVVMQIALFAVVRTAASANYEARYMAGVFPFFLALVVYGLLRAAAVLAGGRRAGHAAGAVLCAAGIGASLYPAYLQTQLTGLPAPYFDLIRWTDANLPPGTPVLVDRWFEPWNEIKAHPNTNVNFTFTIPNEPVDVYIQNRWRDSARAFLAKYPDAAYLEVAKSYWEAPGVGAWSWPREYFAHHVGITNEAGLELRRLGLANRGDFYAATTNRVILDLFYNRPEDVVEKARAAGRQVIALYGPGWQYSKPFMALNGSDERYRDAWTALAQAGFREYFSDWRVLEEAAAVDVVNLASSNLMVEVTVRAVATPSSKQVEVVGGARMVFGAGQFASKVVAAAELPPGISRLVLRDSLWPSAKVPLMVESVSVGAVAARPAPPQEIQQP